MNELKEWLLSNGVAYVVMESIGVYWKPVYKVLEDSTPNVWIVVNARHIKNVPRHKTDKMDSEWAATRTKDTFFSERYHRIAACRRKKRALIAVEHSLSSELKKIGYNVSLTKVP